MKKRITWVTADYFIDVDLPIVPILKETYNIDWFVLKSHNSRIEIPSGYSFTVLACEYRNLDPRIIFFYRKAIVNFLNYNPEFLYVNFVGMPYFYPLLFLMSKSRKIIHASHNVIPYAGWPNKRLMTFYLNFVFRKNTYFQLFSKFLFNYFINKYKDKKCFYAPLALKSYGDLATNNYILDHSKINFLFFGNIKKNKKLELLIEAVTKLPANVKGKIHFTIAGSCTDEMMYRDLIGNSSIISCYFKRIPDIEVPELFLKHHFLVLPYEEVAQSGPHMIAYNYNLPVIATNIEGFRERIIDNVNGFLFNVNDLQDLKRTLIKATLLSNDEYINMKNSLAEFVRTNFTNEVISNQYKTFFESL